MPFAPLAQGANRVASICRLSPSCLAGPRRRPGRPARPTADEVRESGSVSWQAVPRLELPRGSGNPALHVRQVLKRRLALHRRSALLLVIPFVVGQFGGSSAFASGSGVGTIPQGTQTDAAYAASYTLHGVSNVSATTQTDLALHGAGGEPEGSSRGLDAHELAHQWFGDLTTPPTWAHIWPT